MYTSIMDILYSFDPKSSFDKDTKASSSWNSINDFMVIAGSQRVSSRTRANAV